jgi:hypothetical protein
MNVKPQATSDRQRALPIRGSSTALSRPARRCGTSGYRFRYILTAALAYESDKRLYQAPGDQALYSSETLVLQALQLARAAADEHRTVVLVEGLSDRAAIHALAKGRGRNLEEEGITTIAMGGATRIWRFLDLLGPRGGNAKVAGLYESLRPWMVCCPAFRNDRRKLVRMTNDK